jgi:hypothetical protein
VLFCEGCPVKLETRGQPRSVRFPGPGKCLITSCKALEENEKTATGHVIVTGKPQWERNGHSSGQSVDGRRHACTPLMKNITSLYNPCPLNSSFQRIIYLPDARLAPLSRYPFGPPHRLVPCSDNAKRVAGLNGGALNTMTRTAHSFPFTQCMPVDPPSLAMWAKGVEDPKLLVASLAVWAE